MARPTEIADFPIIPHSAGGVDCCGCMVVNMRGKDAEQRVRSGAWGDRLRDPLGTDFAYADNALLGRLNLDLHCWPSQPAIRNQ
jgi:hypothetical protein